VARSLVLADQVAVELGNPSAGSLSATLWTRERILAGSAVYRFGPDLDGLGATSARFGQIALVTGALDDDVDQLLDLQDALCELDLEGVTLRARPSSADVWYRVSRQAMSRGFSLRHLGGALLRSLETLDGFEAAALLFLVEGAEPWPARLETLARDASLVARSLFKRSTEHEAECETCEFSEVCEDAVRR
jgi:CO dehydrogenase/acetyl-CoA synthase beta subunit